MVLQAAADLNINLSQSWIVGDSTADVAMANQLGISSVLVLTGEGGRDGRYPAHADHVCNDLEAASELITSIMPAVEKMLCGHLDQITNGSLVIIGGLSRSGKSVVATALRRLLARRCATASVSLDRWLKPVNDRSTGVLGRYDMEGAYRSFAPWLSGGGMQAVLPSYNRITREVDTGGSILDLPGDGTLVIEGVPALLGTWRTSRPIVKIWVQESNSKRMDRLVEDIAIRHGVSREEAILIADSRKLDEDILIESTRNSASICVDIDLMQVESV